MGFARAQPILRRCRAVADPQCQTATPSLSRPATAGRGDRTKCGGRGAGIDDPLATTTKRRVRRPLHHATRGPPPPLSWGRIQTIILAMRLRIRALLHASRKPFPLTPFKRREAERQKARLPLPCPAGPGARHADECCHSPALRARSPFGAPPRYSPEARRPTGSAPGHASWDADPAGVTRLHLSQSRDCTSRAGRSTGVTDAQSRPGTVCETARGNRTCSTF